MPRGIGSLVVALLLFMILGCGAGVHVPGMSLTAENNAVMFGRIATHLIGPTTRPAQPSVLFFDIQNQESGGRYRIHVEGSNTPMVFTLPPGTYILTRMVIGEGVFRAVANPNVRFHIEQHRVNYLGIWNVNVSSPSYRRTMQVEVRPQLEQSLADLKKKHPSLAKLSIVSQELTPSFVETRLFEMAPYPKVRYFNRHHTT